MRVCSFLRKRPTRRLNQQHTRAVQVVANAVAALTEIHEASQQDVLKINSSSLKKLLVALNECTEWGQVHLQFFALINASYGLNVKLIVAGSFILFWGIRPSR